MEQITRKEVIGLLRNFQQRMAAKRGMCDEHDGALWDNAESVIAALQAAEPVAWQFYEDGEWHSGDRKIAGYRRNTEAAGIPVRDLFALPCLPAKAQVPEFLLEMSKQMRELIEKEAETFFEFPTDDRAHVTTVSCKLFAEHVLAKLAQTQQAQGEPFAYCHLDVNGKASELCSAPCADDDPRDTRTVQALYKHPPAPATVPGGWKMVPVEPTDHMSDVGMVSAGIDITENDARHVYSAMLDASPQPVEQQPVPEGHKGANVLVEVLESIIEHYPHPDIDHERFRVLACRFAEQALAAYRKQGGEA